MAVALAAKVPVGQAAQLVVNERKERG